MAANTSPIFSKQADIHGRLPRSSRQYGQGRHRSVATVFTADATEGGRIEKIVARAIGTNVATVLRVFVNNGSSNATPANNMLVAEMTLPATTLSEVAAQPAYELPLNLPCRLATRSMHNRHSGGGGLHATAIGSKY